jgi:hypothetical protein
MGYSTGNRLIKPAQIIIPPPESNLFSELQDNSGLNLFIHTVSYILLLDEVFVIN